MKFWCFKSVDGNFLCKNKLNNSIYESNIEFDRLITYRRKKMIENIKRDTQYWKHRNIDIDKYEIISIEYNLIYNHNPLINLKNEFKDNCWDFINSDYGAYYYCIFCDCHADTYSELIHLPDCLITKFEKILDNNFE